MVGAGTGGSLRRYAAGGAVSALGLAALGIPLYDILDDTTNLGWGVAASVAENAVLIALAMTLVFGGVRLVRLDWETRHVRSVAERTAVGTAAVAVLIGWVIVSQLRVMGGLKPFIIALDAVLIGAVTVFALAFYSVKSSVQARDLAVERGIAERLATLHDHAARLGAIEDREAAAEVALDAVRETVAPEGVRIAVDDAVFGDRPAASADGGTGDGADAGPGVGRSVPVGCRGRIDLLGESFAEHEVETVELLAVHLDRTLTRLDDERAIREERERLEFINRTIRHNLLNDMQVVSSRLEVVDEGDEPFERHAGVIRSRIDGMASFIHTMKEYMNTLLEDEHELRTVPLTPLVREQVADARDGHPEAEIEVEELPSVSVRADDLLEPVVENLLTNAVVHSDRETPHVEVAAAHDREGGTVTLHVRDDGPGIDDERKEAVFERGERGRDSGGTGFGLYLVGDAVEAYGGAVDIRDNEPRGTVVSVTLPVAEA
ncbi:hypothetical protein GCM10027435_16240 [Haloparvum alkalitolerans]|uniref:sensor histidine kinase n=1 Tax=Haloparvum alkalitolerans TaxID=1042953 RepID=UPI003CF2827E